MEAMSNNSYQENPDDETSSALQIIFLLTDFTYKYVLGVFVTLGIFGNVLSVVVFVRCRKKDQVTVTYLTPLAVADLVTLLWGAYSWIVNGILEQDSGYFFIEPPYSLGPQILCKSMRYIYGISSCVSSYLIVMFSLERCLGVWTPIKVHFIITRSRRRNAIIGMICCCILINLPILVFFWVFNYQGTGFLGCFFYVPHFTRLGRYLLVKVMSHLIPLAIPCVLIIVLSVLIVVGLKRSKKEAALSTGREQKDSSSLVTLLLVAGLYLVSTLPYLGVFGFCDYHDIMVGEFPGMTSEEVKAMASLGIFTISFSMMNYSFNFLIYASTLKVYREELRTMAKALVSLWKG